MPSPELPEDAAVAPSAPQLAPGLIEALTSAYAALVKRQRTASSAFVRWSSSSRRSHEFAWLEPGDENIISRGKAIGVSGASALGQALNKMMATSELNPYERELLYGYPYLVGQVDGIPIRAPLLTIPVVITAEGGQLIVAPNEEMIRFNSLPFRSEADSAAHELALARLIELTPEHPVRPSELASFCESLVREMRVGGGARLDGSLTAPPSEPRRDGSLRIVDNAACFVAPKTSYFIASDLQRIGEEGRGSITGTALGWLVGGRPQEPTSDAFADSKRVCFPFASNPSQRRVAVLAEDPTNRLIVVQGPPGTGKSLTIANTVCHLVAQGKRVLVTSQKDKALDVVDYLLRRLNLVQMPMTLLRQDRDSRRELRERLDAVQKHRAAQDTHDDWVRLAGEHTGSVEQSIAIERLLAEALRAEHTVAVADREAADASGFLQRLLGKWRFRQTLRAADRRSRRCSDDIGDSASEYRRKLLAASLELLRIAAELRTGKATKAARNQLREFAKLLSRNQTTFKNFSIFDRMKSDPERCHMLLGILPCWIMAPDDVCRLFPCEPGLFDFVIVDEASQCDLPSMTPILFRAKQAIVVGDSKQMQAQRFAFTGSQVADQAWRQHGMDRLDPDGWLHPARIDLLQLASIRMDEEVFLDEHFRSLPPIISFSNDRWYGGRLRLMRDESDRRVGDPESPTIRLHRVQHGRVESGTQENRVEAEALVVHLAKLISHPGYDQASFGVICLFEEQMRLVSELVSERISEEDRTDHELVVVNPDGFQGDERDVVLYSLSYDAVGMPVAALSARQADRPHIQGMLNVAFTRGRDELHVFHSAPVDQFGMASGDGAIREWLEHCSKNCAAPVPPTSRQVSKADSEFEAQVIQALEARGFSTIAQYPSCGFFIDVVAEKEDQRLAIECDGEIWHLDEHGELRIEDVRRQEILERAGWRVLRVPYRGWLADPEEQLTRIELALVPAESTPETDDESGGTTHGVVLKLGRYEAAVVASLKTGTREHEAVLKGARINLGSSRMGPQIRRSLEFAIQTLEKKKVVIREDGELFLSESARNASVSTVPQAPTTLAPGQRTVGYRRRRFRRRW